MTEDMEKNMAKDIVLDGIEDGIEEVTLKRASFEKPYRSWVYIWALIGVSLLLMQALWRLTPLAIEAWNMELSLFQRSICVAWVLLNAYTEGYRAFQKRFCPRVLRRAHELAARTASYRDVLAPAYAMSLFDAPKREMWVSRLVVAAIVVLVICVRQLAQPWRGIIDAGVVVGLLWGLICLWSGVCSRWRELV